MSIASLTIKVSGVNEVTQILSDGDYEVVFMLWDELYWSGIGMSLQILICVYDWYKFKWVYCYSLGVQL